MKNNHIFKPNKTSKNVVEAEKQIATDFGSKPWFIKTEVEYDAGLGFFLNVKTAHNGFEQAKTELPLILNNAFIVVEDVLNVIPIK